MLLDALIYKRTGFIFPDCNGFFRSTDDIPIRQDRKRDASYFKGTWKIFVVIIVIVTCLVPVCYQPELVT